MGLAFSIRLGVILGALNLHLHASLLVGNDSPLPKNWSVTVEGPQEPAISFTMPPEAYAIDSVTLSLRNYTSASDTPSIGFYTDLSGKPGTLLGTRLKNPYSASDSSSDFTFFPNGSLTLNPGETYWILVSSSAGSFAWNACEPSVAPPPSGVASFDAYKVGLNYGAAYVDDHPIPSFTIHATAVPEPCPLVLDGLGAGGILFLARRSRR